MVWRIRQAHASHSDAAGLCLIISSKTATMFMVVDLHWFFQAIHDPQGCQQPCWL
jgi:hypothetical protein